MLCECCPLLNYSRAQPAVIWLERQRSHIVGWPQKGPQRSASLTAEKGVNVPLSHGMAGLELVAGTQASRFQYNRSHHCPLQRVRYLRLFKKRSQHAFLSPASHPEWFPKRVISSEAFTGADAWENFIVSIMGFPCVLFFRIKNTS